MSEPTIETLPTQILKPVNRGPIERPPAPIVTTFKLYERTVLQAMGYGAAYTAGALVVVTTVALVVFVAYLVFRESGWV